MEEKSPEKRIRLAFTARHLLNKVQRSDGLRRCWVIIQPSICTISDLARHIHRSFHLDDVSPDALVFSMDGFVLPFFESVRILRDGDMIRVNKKDDLPIVIENQNEMKQIEDSQIVEKRPFLSDLKLLEYDNFGSDAAGFQSEHGSESDHDGNALNSGRPAVMKKRKRPNGKQDTSEQGSESDHDGNALNSGRPAVMKKRKRPNGKQDARKKKTKRNATEETTSKNIDGHGNIMGKEASDEEDLALKKHSSVGRSAQVKGVDDHPLQGTKNHNLGRHDKLHNDVEEQNGTLTASSGAKKIPSRSARRKKAKRQWIRKMACSQNTEPFKDQLPDKDFQKDLSTSAEEHDQQNDVDDGELVPVVLKPGHIRFEPVGKVSAAEQDNMRHEDPEETIKWNGTTCKRKGQKWGMEKSSVHKLSSSTSCEKKDLIVEKEVVADEPVDFEKLPCLSGLPEDGDVIAYRLVELSSSWCPDLSPFRVGKVSSYSPESTVITLVPVADYPLTFHQEQQEDIEEYSTSTSLYKEDGSLEVEFASLIEVRLLNREKRNQLPALTADKTIVNSNVATTCIQQGASVSVSNSRDEKIQTSPQENVHTTSWYEITQALDEKKAELSKQVDICTKKGDSTKGSSSYKALRRSALGPTIALLRAENSL